MSPLGILRIWFFGLLSLTILGGGGYLLWEWYDGGREREYLWSAVALLSLSFLGKWLVMPFLGLGQVGEPRLERGKNSRRLERPDGTDLYVEFHGPEDAPPLVLIHGWSMDSRVWYYAKRELADRFRLILWDLRGAGQSSPPDNNDYSLEQMADDLNAVIDLAGRPVALLGHSIGGMVIQKFCQRHPQALGTRVERIILVGTTNTNPVHTTSLRGLAQAIQKPILEPLLHLAIWTSPLVWLMNWQSYQNGTSHLSTRRSSFAGKQTWGQVDFAARLSALQSPAAMARGTLAMFRFDAQEALSQIPVPVLVIHGFDDRPVQIDAGERISQLIPQARFKQLQPAGHQCILEQNAEFARAVEDFLSEKLYVAKREAI